MSLENTIICRRCGYVRLYFPGIIGYNGKLVPYEFHNPGLVHKCDISPSFECVRCNELCYFDKKVLSPSGKRRALNQSDGKDHVCKGRSDSIES